MFKKPQEVIKAGESTTMVQVPQSFVIDLGSEGKIKFDEGIIEIPDRLLDHWYVKANGVKPFTRAVYPPPKPFVANEDHLTFMQKVGIEGVTTVDEASNFINRLDSGSRKQFDLDYASWLKNRSDKPIDLSLMNKEQLVKHAADAHGLELDPKRKKDELIAAIEEAAAKK